MTREKRDRYLQLMEECLASPYRRCREYGKYLRRYFDPAVERVDGMPYQRRIESSEPMSYNVYFNG